MKAHGALWIVCAVLGLALATGNASAAPVWGDVFKLRQPDGALVDVKIWGDEFYQVVESLDGYTLMRDPATGIICYATLSGDGQKLVSTGVAIDAPGKAGLHLESHVRIRPEAVRLQVNAARARLAVPAQRTKSIRPPTLGAVQGICLIVDFPDDPATISAQEVNDFCNKAGYNGFGNNGSVHDYYYDVSNGAFDYTNFVPAAYYTAQYNKSHYDDPNQSTGPGACELITEALVDLDSHGFDFSQYDANGDGAVDALNCYYAGYTSSGWSRGLWPHSGPLIYQLDGVTTIQYQISDMGTNLEIGTFCHENGHLVGWWPDLYDYDYDSAGIGRFCLMCGGGHGTNPVEPCAFLKDMAGWSNTFMLSGLFQTGLTATAGNNFVYKFPNPANAKEYYMIENRQRTGRDANIPDSGLAIWHIDEMGNNSLNEMTPQRHFRVTLVQADGRWDLEHDQNSGDTTDLWKVPTYTLCTPNTSPNTGWWAGNISYLYISNVSASGASMTFDYQGLGSPAADYDGDGMSDWDETRDLDPNTPGVQNPFDPINPDVTGDNGSNDPDGITDGDNDYDADGLSNAVELRAGSNPIDPHSGLPVASTAGLAVLATLLAGAFVITQRSRRDTDRGRA